MKKLGDIALWVIIIAGLVLGYEGVTGRDVIGALVRSTRMEYLIYDVIGICALIVLGGKIKK